MQNIPAISDERCMQRLPEARAKERDCLLGKVSIAPGSKVLDIQAAAGYLSDKIYQNLAGEVTCFCVEPSDIHRLRIPSQHVALSDPVEHFVSLQDDSMDVAVGLAGLHHSESHQATINEVSRVLKSGGQVAICDVIEGSNIARWLNEYVDANTASGHCGHFLQQGRLSEQLAQAGFENIQERVEQVPWRFPSEPELVSFFKGLFGLESSLEEVSEAIHHYFTLKETQGSIELPWSLIYASASKPKLAH